MLVEMFQNQMYNVVVLLQGLCEDEDIIEVYIHHSFYDEVIEDVIFCGSKCSQTIDEAKEHDQQLKQPSVGSEYCLPIISFFDAHIVIAPADI